MRYIICVVVAAVLISNVIQPLQRACEVVMTLDMESQEREATRHNESILKFIENRNAAKR